MKEKDIRLLEDQNAELIEALTQLQQKDSLIKRLDKELVDAEQLAKKIYDKLVKAEERLEQFEGACKKWVKVEDQLPKVLTNVLVAVKDGLGIYETTIAFQGRGKWVLRDQAVRGTITHWMPLPEPPPEN